MNHSVSTIAAALLWGDLIHGHCAVGCNMVDSSVLHRIYEAAVIALDDIIYKAALRIMIYMPETAVRQIIGDYITT